MLLGIQYLRGLAALLVVLHHAAYRQKVYGNGDFALEIGFGAGGVDIFFVISGFIMYYITQNKEESAASFLKARIIRIAPNYYIWTLIFVVYYAASGIEFTDLVHLTKSLLFIPTFHPGFDNEVWFIWPPLIQGWTLNYEMFFYFVFFAGLLLGLRRLFTVGCLILLCILGQLFTPASPVLYTFTSPMLLEFLLGIWLAQFYFSRLSLPTSLGFAAIVLGCVLFPYFEKFPITNIPVSGAWVLNRGIPAFLIVFGTVILEKNRAVPKLYFPLWLGNISYSLYLSHVFVLEEWGRSWKYFQIGTVLPDASLMIVGITLSIVLGGVFFKYIEVPAISFLREKTNRMLPAPRYALYVVASILFSLIFLELGFLSL